MGSHLTSVEIHNMQSWSEQSGVMEFNPEVLNVIKGRNETGKSVVFKIIYEMVFPGYHGAQYLVRRGAEFGSALFNYADGISVLFVLYPNGSRLYGVYKDNQLTPYNVTRIPDEIIQIMGLVISWDTRIILNVLDKDIPMPFIKTDSTYNASLLQSKLEPIEITNMFVRAKDYLTRIQSAKAVFSRKEAYWQAKCDALDKTDPADIQYQLAFLNSRTHIYYPLVGLYNDLCDLDEVLAREPSVPAYDLDSAQNLLKLLSHVNEVARVISDIKHVVNSKPIEPRHTVEQLETGSQLLMTLQSLARVDQVIIDIDGLKKPIVPALPSIEPQFKVLSALNYTQMMCRELTCLKPVNVPRDPANSDKLMKILQEALQVRRNFNQLVLLCVEQIKASQAVQALQEQITQLEHQLGICPLCGRRYEDE